MTPAKMPQWIDGTITALIDRVKEYGLSFLRLDVSGIKPLLFADRLVYQLAADWMQSNNAVVCQWMRAAGVTEIHITQDGATWG